MPVNGPSVQYLVKGGGGRWQTTSAAWDTEKKEWFDTLSGDARTGEDWGHWSGRGMTWNVQCAYCHMTGFEKNYNVKIDGFPTIYLVKGEQVIEYDAKPNEKTLTEFLHTTL